MKSLVSGEFLEKANKRYEGGSQAQETIGTAYGALMRELLYL